MTEKQIKIKRERKAPFFIRRLLKLTEDLKLLTSFIVIAVLSAYLRYKTFARFCCDSVLGFLMGYSIYLALGYFELPGGVKSGISGMVIIWSRPLYDFVNSFISTKLSDVIVERLKKHD